MTSRWRSGEAASFEGPLGGCVYASRLIGSDRSLVLHGGGNSSAKAPFTDITGRSIDAIWVKGSGWDMGTIEAEGFAALRLERLHELLELERLSDADMARELRAAKLDPTHPDPSVESLLHAFLPYGAALHSHADAIVTLTNTDRAERNVRDVFGTDVVVIPYVMPGFDLARLVARDWAGTATGSELGMVLMNHGLFTFGDDAQVAYERHIDLIERAESWLDEHAPRSTLDPAEQDRAPHPDWKTVVQVRADVSEAAGRPMIVQRHSDPAITRFLARGDLAAAAGSGPLTPDHVIRTKRLPLVGTDVGSYVGEYEHYVESHRARKPDELESVDPAPRVVLEPPLGMLAVGETWAAATIASDIYRQTIPVIERSMDHLGGYRALPAEDIFDVEYWDLEQAKLRARAKPAELAGQVAIVTGAASGIGQACAQELARLGAVVVGVDIAESIEDFDVGPGSLGIRADLTDDDAHARIVERAVLHAGGVDLAVLSAGIFGAIARIEDLDLGVFRTVHDINLHATVGMMTALHPALARSPVGGRVVAIASKNVPAPGVGAAAYSTSKAALAQLVRVAALEWAADAIRVNGVHPDAVFDTGLWDDDALATRARHYGLTIEEYKARNLLKLEITSKDVALAVAALCTDRFRATTGAFLPIDGGNERVI